MDALTVVCAAIAAISTVAAFVVARGRTSPHHGRVPYWLLALQAGATVVTLVLVLLVVIRA